MIYLDTSALMKLVRTEAGSAPLREWLRDHSASGAATSELGRIECIRAARRMDDATLREARAVINEVDLIPLDHAVQDLACEVGQASLRSLDALHLASAILLGDNLTTFVAYDHRLLDAARSVDLRTASPGAAD